jgi:hypothetical protein
VSRLAVLAILAALLAVPAANAALTKQQVIARGSTICRAAERRVEAAPQPRSQSPFAATAPTGDRQRAIAFLGVYAQALESVRVGLGRLDAPAPDRGLLERFVADLGPTVALFRRAHSEALHGQYSAAMTHTQAAFALFAKASASTKRYGFAKGVCQSGA